LARSFPGFYSPRQDPVIPRSFISPGDEESAIPAPAPGGFTGTVLVAVLLSFWTASDDAPGFLLRFGFAGFVETGPADAGVAQR
jgi:hypothetical protein